MKQDMLCLTGRWIVVVGLAITLTAHAAKIDKTETTKDNLDQIKEKIQALSSQLSATKVAKQDANQALKASESAISASRKKLRDIQAAQLENRQRLRDLQKKMVQLEQQVNAQKQAMQAQLNQQYRHGNQSRLQRLLQANDPAQASRDLHYLGHLTAAHQAHIASLQNNQEDIDRVRAETAEQAQQTDALAQQYQETTQQLEQEKSKRAQALAQLSKQMNSQEQQLTRLKKDEEALTRLFEKLLAEARKREQEAQARAKREAQAEAKRQAEQTKSKKSAGRTFEHATQSKVDDNEANTNPSVVAKNDTLPEFNGNKEQFSTLKGKLRLPVRGEVVNRFGSPRRDTGVNWKGLFIRASEGSEVKTVSSGQVVFADWMRGFGNLIVVDHGGGYMSLYGNNEALYKSSGQIVKAGDTIATVGNSGGNAESGVYYELRRNSLPFDPLQWSIVH